MVDVVGWLLAGLVAGGLASAATSGRSALDLAAVVATGVLGGLLGGWAGSLLFGSGTTSFLGAVIVSVAGALALLARLHQRQTSHRYRF